MLGEDGGGLIHAARFPAIGVALCRAVFHGPIDLSGVDGDASVRLGHALRRQGNGMTVVPGRQGEALKGGGALDVHGQGHGEACFCRQEDVGLALPRRKEAAVEPGVFAEGAVRQAVADVVYLHGVVVAVPSLGQIVGGHFA